MQSHQDKEQHHHHNHHHRKRYEEENQPAATRSGTEFQHGNRRAPQLNDQVESKHSNVAHGRKKRKAASGRLGHGAVRNSNHMRQPQRAPTFGRRLVGKTTRLVKRGVEKFVPLYKRYAQNYFRLVHAKVKHRRGPRATNHAAVARRIDRNLVHNVGSISGTNGGHDHDDIELDGSEPGLPAVGHVSDRLGIGAWIKDQFQ